jgi:hypothetical protein
MDRSYPLSKPHVFHTFKSVGLYSAPISEIRFDGSYLGVRIRRSQEI